MSTLLPRTLLTLVVATMIAAGLPATDAWAKKDHHKKAHWKHHHHGVVHHGPPDWAPAHGYRHKMEYLYYPAYKVYYAPATRQYFWLDGGVVQVGLRLPAGIRVGHGGIAIELPHDTPAIIDFSR